MITPNATYGLPNRRVSTYKPRTMTQGSAQLIQAVYIEELYTNRNTPTRVTPYIQISKLNQREQKHHI